MGFLDFVGLGKWKPDLKREPPARDEWPDHVVTLKTKIFDPFIDKYPLSVVDFWAPWCGPCKAMVPLIKNLSRSYRGRVAFGKLDIKENKRTAIKYHIMAVPNLIFFSYGKKITNMTGVRPIGEFRKKIDEILYKFKINDENDT